MATIEIGTHSHHLINANILDQSIKDTGFLTGYHQEGITSSDKKEFALGRIGSVALMAFGFYKLVGSFGSSSPGAIVFYGTIWGLTYIAGHDMYTFFYNRTQKMENFKAAVSETLEKISHIKDSIMGETVSQADQQDRINLANADVWCKDTILASHVVHFLRHYVYNSKTEDSKLTGAK